MIMDVYQNLQFEREIYSKLQEASKKRYFSKDMRKAMREAIGVRGES